MPPQTRPRPFPRHRLGKNSDCETVQGQPAGDSVTAVKLIADESHGPHISGAHRYYPALPSRDLAFTFHFAVLFCNCRASTRRAAAKHAIQNLI